MAKEKDVIIAFRAPATLRDIVEQFILLDTHMNESDFCRDAVRQKIQREAPDLYKRLFEKEPEKE
jgi:hypothetical protein